MPDLAPLLTLGSPVTPAGPGLPRHLYGTRAALFYLLREADGPAALAPPAPAPLASLSRLAAPPARIMPVASEPAPPARSALREMLQSDSFDFRGFGERG